MKQDRPSTDPQQPIEEMSSFNEAIEDEAPLTDDLGKKEKKKKKKKKTKELPKPTLGSSRGVETMFRTSYRTHIDLSGLADNKANIMISINGIIVSIIIASISPKIDANPWLLIPTSVLLICCLISLVYAILAARPRVSSRPLTLDSMRQQNTNILFFGNFVNLSERDFVEGMTDLMQHMEGLYENMIRDIYGLGCVLARKFKLLRISYTVFMFGLVLGVLLFIAVYIGVVFTGGSSSPIP